MLTEHKTADLIYERPKSLSQMATHYCPGCTHGTAHRLVAEVLDEQQSQRWKEFVTGIRRRWIPPLPEESSGEAATELREGIGSD